MKGKRIENAFDEHKGCPSEYRHFATEAGHEDPDGEWLIFFDYWADKTGQGATKISWERTWRNWIRRSLKGWGGSAPNTNGYQRVCGGTIASGARMALDRRRDKERAQQLLRQEGAQRSF